MGLVSAIRRTTQPSPADGERIELGVDSRGNLLVTIVDRDGTTLATLPVTGNVASGAADSGNPVKVGGRNNTTLPTLADGQRGDLQLDTRGNLRVAIVGANATGGAAVTTGQDSIASAVAGTFVFSTGLKFNGTSLDRDRTPNVLKTVAATAITAGTGATIWTPAAGKKFRLMGWSLSVTVGASLIFGDNAIGTVIARTELLAAAGISQNPPGLGNSFLSAAANNVLKLDVTVGATVSGFVFGTEE